MKEILRGEKMKEIKQNNIIYAIVDTPKSLERLDVGELLEGTKWYSDKLEPLQGARMFYHAGKEFKVHSHKLNPRTVNHTQEALICFAGKAEVEVYNFDKELIETVILESGSIIFLYRGYHGLKIKHNNTILYELKAGQFSSVEDDKEFLEEK